jgi:hypothetical protein
MFIKANSAKIVLFSGLLMSSLTKMPRGGAWLVILSQHPGGSPLIKYSLQIDALVHLLLSKSTPYGTSHSISDGEWLQHRDHRVGTLENATSPWRSQQYSEVITI